MVNLHNYEDTSNAGATYAVNQRNYLQGKQLKIC